MASSITLYANGKLNMLRAIDMSVGGTTNFKVGLVGASLGAYVPNASTDAVWATPSAYEIANANGYTTGGIGFNTPTLTLSGSTVTFAETTNAVWTASGGSIVAEYAVIYAVGTFNALVNPLIAYILMDTTPNLITVTSGNTLTLAWNASGIITWT
jgi:hypothetical protein